MNVCRYNKQVEKWGVFEVRVLGKMEGNPFTDYEIKGVFKGQEESKTVNGFYDGNGEYVVRFMPNFEGNYEFELSGSFSEQSYKGAFESNKPTDNNHGYVHVSDNCHFKYADKTPYYSVGTTCYAWVHQPVKRQEQTLRTLENNAFNKIRFCIFPKHYDYNYADPIAFPYEGSPCDPSGLNRDTVVAYMEDKSSNDWNFSKFNPEYFQWFDLRIGQLMDMGIEADLILFHPYDRWGFDGMGKEYDDLYVKYVVARYSAYRNVWWSLANEYDYVKTKTGEDWERIASLLCENDKYGRLRSIHNGPQFYDFSKPWITHCSCQGTDRYKSVETTDELMLKYNKPVVWDEILYEGNLDLGFGNITGEELVRRFWEASIRGGYAGHGETYLESPDDRGEQPVLWWSHGGLLHGESPKRITFLLKILSEIPGGYGLRSMPKFWDAVVGIIDHEPDKDKEGRDYYLFYFGFLRPLYKDFYFDENTEYSVDLIDTWNMTSVSQGIHKGHFRINTGGRTYMAVRIQKV